MVRAGVAFPLRIALLALLAVFGCKRSDDLNESRQMPKLSPPPDSSAPSELAVAVEIDGHAAPPLDHAKLDATRPDFVDGDRRAWRIKTLLGASAERDGAIFTVTGDQDVAIVLRHPKSDDDRAPVLVMNRRGQILAAMVVKSDPFPSYHGQGHRLERRGDPLPRVEGVKRIVVSLNPSDASP